MTKSLLNDLPCPAMEHFLKDNYIIVALLELFNNGSGSRRTAVAFGDVGEHLHVPRQQPQRILSKDRSAEEE